MIVYAFPKNGCPPQSIAALAPSYTLPFLDICVPNYILYQLLKQIAKQNNTSNNRHNSFSTYRPLREGWSPPVLANGV